MKLLIDGDIVAYRCGFAAQKGRGEEVVAEPVENALNNVRSCIDAIVEQLESADLCIYLSGGDNYRFDIATERPYKGNREDTPKPVHYRAIIDYITRTFPYQVSDGQEADDDMGVEQTRLTQGNRFPGHSCIVSTDKDMDMIPGNHFNFVKSLPYHVDESEAWECFFTQLITGDSVDNVPGIPGKGPAAAKKALAGLTDPESMYQAVRALYVQAFTEKNADEALLEQARLLWIRRNNNELWESDYVSRYACPARCSPVASDSSGDLRVSD